MEISILNNNQQCLNVDVNFTGIELIQSFAPHLMAEAIAIKVNDKIYDIRDKLVDIKNKFDSSLTTKVSIKQSCDLEITILTYQDKESLDIIRHDCAHILAQAVLELYPNAKIATGPTTEEGFFYDFNLDGVSISEDDLVSIEKTMRKIVDRNYPVTREVISRDEAINLFTNLKQSYKVELIANIPNEELITIYRQGSFVDLCRGPHGQSTSKVPHFKLNKVSGAYWKGDHKSAVLQRIYGLAQGSKEDLERYLNMLEEAKKRDHRLLGKQLNLFHLQEEAQGMVFWHHKGWLLYCIIEDYIRSKLKENNYIEVKTPSILSKKFWEQSGHWEKFRHNMFVLDLNPEQAAYAIENNLSEEQDQKVSKKTSEEILAIKPMNCPCHIQIFNHSGTKSYRDLPLRMAEFGSCHRYEPSGALHGLMRTRGFVQDDAHIFCTKDQITEESIKFINLLKEVYKDFGFLDIEVKLADRPEIRIGKDEIWDEAEASLFEAVKASNLQYTINKGEGAFYGPKLEFVLLDSIGRKWQCGTLQVDFVLAERLGAYYISPENQKKHPVLLHRAILGSFERFIGILIEQYGGNFPLWLAPVQIVLCTISQDPNMIEYVRNIQKKMEANHIRCEIDISEDRISQKINMLSNRKVPIIAVIGNKEVANNTVSIRQLGIQEVRVLSTEELIGIILDRVNSKHNNSNII